MFQNSLFYLQQGTAYVVEQEENSIFLLSNNLAFTLRPQDLGSKIHTKAKILIKANSNDISSNNVLINKDSKSKSKHKSKSTVKLNSQSINQLQQQDITINSNNNYNLNPFEDVNLNYKSFPIELVRFKNSHYSYPLAKTSLNFNVQEFYNSHALLNFNRAYTSARILNATKGGFLCIICGILGFLPRSHSPRFLRFFNLIKRQKQNLKSNNTIKSRKFFIRKKFKNLALKSFKTLYSFSYLCERNFYLSIPCRYLSRVIYPPKFSRGRFKFNFIFTSLPLKVILKEMTKELTSENNSNSHVNSNFSFKTKTTKKLVTGSKRIIK